MEAKCLSRKRIWEIDCLSLDAAIAAAFDWRDLVNILQSHGYSLDLNKAESLLELQAQCLIHECCHSENAVSLKLESLLNEWHKGVLNFFDGQSASEVAEYVLTTVWNEPSSYAGLFWSLGSDPRVGFDGIRRRFHQRFQISAVRRLTPKAA